MSRPLLTPGDAGRFLGVTAACLEKWRHRRVGPPWCVVGSLIRYRPEAIEEWLQARTFNVPGGGKVVPMRRKQ